MDEVECVVVGAGVIGLAAARALALAGIEVLVLEQAYTIGFETSSRNSEVIHGGLYYPAGSLKARSCVEGRQRLYAYCREHGVAACPARQADRRHQRGGDRRPREDRRHGPRPTASTIWNGSTRRRRRGSNPPSIAWRPCCRPRPASSTATR